jgi:hypothetical protein
MTITEIDLNKNFYEKDGFSYEIVHYEDSLDFRIVEYPENTIWVKIVGILEGRVDATFLSQVINKVDDTISYEFLEVDVKRE